jgi:hypothetical protein
LTVGIKKTGIKKLFRYVDTCKLMSCTILHILSPSILNTGFVPNELSGIINNKARC